jgi:polyphosphate kinase
VYLASADWMPRNLYERVEVMFPVKDELLRERVRQEILESYLADNLKARFLQKDGSYVRAWQTQGKRKPPAGSAAFSAQDFLIGLAEGRQALDAIPAAPTPSSRRTTVGRER